MSVTAHRPDPHGWRQEGKDLVRAVAAGSIVGMPLLYTMEMWFHGMTTSPGHQLLLLGGVLGVNFLFCLFSGFRDEYSALEAAGESVTSVAIGMLYALGVLAMIGEIQWTMDISESLGKVLLEAAPVSVGVSFANVQIGRKTRTGSEQEASRRRAPAGDAMSRQLRQDLQEMAVTVTGATVFALNIAPTEEVILIATRLHPWQLALLAGASLVLCYLILFAAEFQVRSVHVESAIQHPLAETVIAYALSLLVSFVLLYLVGMDEAMSDAKLAAAATVVLGLPATVGGAAGRLIT